MAGSGTSRSRLDHPVISLAAFAPPLYPFADWRGRHLDTARPKLRSDLIVRAEADGTQTAYIVKDPITGRFFRLRAPEYYLLTRADGQVSVAEALALTNERFGIQIPPTMAQAFFEKMDCLLFFENPATEQALSRATSRTAWRKRTLWTIPVASFDPDAIVTRWTRRIRFVFNPYAIGLCLLFMVGAATIVTGQSGVWITNMAGIWRLTSIPLLLAAVMALAFVHEFGHALTLKFYGGATREMGFLLLYFQPCFYCNLSDSYLIPERSARVRIGLAGLFFQGLATAAAVVMWRMLEPGTLIAGFLWVFTAVSLAIFVFNLNPLIKLDGYYILVDWLRIPNLRAKAFAYWRGIGRRWAWGSNAGRPVASARERSVYRWYGVLAALYTVALVGWLGYWFTWWLDDRWGASGIVIGWGLVLAFAASVRSGQAGTAPADASAEAVVKPKRRWFKPLVFWGLVAIILLVLSIVQWERRVGSPCEVEAGSSFVVTTPTGGTIETMLTEGNSDAGGGMVKRRERSILQATSSDFSVVAYRLGVKEADTVHVGDTLVALTSNLYEANLASAIAKRDQATAERNLLLSGPKKDAVKELRAEIAEAQATVDNRASELERAKMMRDRNLISEEDYQKARTALEVAKAQKQGSNSRLALLISEPKAEELAVKEAELASLEAEITFLREQIAASKITSPIDGIVSRVERGGVLVEVADLDPVRLHLLVHENDIADVRAGASVSLKVRSLPFQTFHGHVAQISDQADTLSSGRRFLVISEMSNASGDLKPGMSGYAKVDCGRRSVLALLTRRLVQFFRVEFWSWF